MAGQVRITTLVEVWDPVKGYYKWPSLRKTFTGLTAVADATFAITASATKSLWDPLTDATEVVADFDVLIAVPDGNLDLELDIDQNASFGRELNSIRIVKDLPFCLGADDAYANHSAGNAFGGTLDLIERLRVKDPTAAARKLRLLMAT